MMPVTIGQPGASFAIGGEQLATTDPDDARHWVLVYTELLAGVQGLGLKDEALRDRWIDTLASRLDLWKERLEEISPI